MQSATAHTPKFDGWLVGLCRQYYYYYYYIVMPLVFTLCPLRDANVFIGSL